MSALNQLKELYNHMTWADAEIWNTILSAPALRKQEDLINSVHHLHLTQYAFYHIWMNLELDFTRWTNFKDIKEIAHWASQYPALIHAFLSGLREKDLAGVIKIPWSGEYGKMLGIQPSDINLAETLFQVLGHSSYHRGQVNRLIRTYGSEPPMVDFIIWIWLGKPPAVWLTPDSINAENN